MKPSSVGSAPVEDYEGSSVVDRRNVVVGLLALAFSAGCGGSSSKASPSTTSASASSASGSSAASSTAAPASNTPSSTVPVDQRIPDDVIASDAEGYNGTWAATFAHTDGTSGPITIDVAIAPSTRTARITVSIGAGFFGPDAAAMNESRDINIDEIALDQQDFSGSTQLFGTGTLRRPNIGSGRVELTGKQLPGRPDIASIAVTTSRLNFSEPHPVQYTMTKVDDTVIAGTATFDRG